MTIEGQAPNTAEELVQRHDVSPGTARSCSDTPESHTTPLGWKVGLASRLPLLGRWAATRALGPAPAPWLFDPVDVPAELLSGAGLPEDDGRERQPLRDFRLVNPRKVTWTREVQPRPASGIRNWMTRFAIDVRLAQVHREARRTRRPRRRRVSEIEDASALTAGLRARGRRVGLSTVGVAAYEERWQFAERRDQVRGERMVVAVIEQDFERMQLAPDPEYQLTVRRTYVRLLAAANQLAAYLRDAGFQARVYEDEGSAMTLPYAVAAGIGQLGMNGQVLTPQSGSRNRMLLISTDAPLELDAPVDYGIPGICSRCGICARRCPAGAISLREREHRGAVKWKIKTDRCLPMVAQADGCAICIKTCPIQRYGLERVLAHYRETGEILGRGSDDESYRWPLDERTYRSGERPSLTPEQRYPAALRS